MAKILKFVSESKTSKQELIEYIENLLEWAKNDDFDNVMIATKLKSCEVMTGYCNLDMVDKQFLNSHIQVDINYETVRANVDNLIEWMEE
ncbi:hypothetical protein CW684_04495 [Macrococcoides caseolyticum]|uniref:hypothetical protein n=1 Tax=Macrococcoides caseolyticum TaxID=69966 RepID=UPI000C32B994|nr:hypothetical protein [Macrococcus caseolyticus]PKF21656.1 hypothetical protein CW684_04495 [Macrococcus caseolyticus]PKF35654.1 hypothetical protein CW687_04495 [Macrococcus caseolyticus]